MSDTMNKCVFTNVEYYMQRTSTQTGRSYPKSLHPQKRSPLEDIQITDPGDTPKAEIERLRKIIWKKRHLLMGKGNALPPAARGAICDIEVGNARPIAQRVRKVAPKLRDKLSELTKVILSSR